MTDHEKPTQELARYEALVENSEDGIYVFTEDGRIEFVNQRVVEVSGIPRDDWIGMEISTLQDLTVLAEEEVAELQEAIQTVLHSEEDEIRVRVSPNVPHGLRDLELRLTPYQTDTGPDHVIGFSRDISEQLDRERELERYRTIVETAGDSIYVLDTDGYLEMVNGAMREYLEAAGQSVEGAHISDFMADGDFERGTELIKELLSDPTRDSGRFEITALTPDGEQIPAEVNVAILTDQAGEYTGSVGVVRDISERKERERELQRKNDRLDEFASIVSHDLRNPLQVAEGRLELAQDDCDSDHLEGIARAQERMSVLIEDLLTLSRGGEAVGETELVDLEQLTERCWGNVATEKATLATDIERSIRADRSRLQQLLENLIRNAVAHGGDDVTVTIGELAGGFYVEDDGPGIPEDDQEDVFDADYSTVEDGTGFGLRIVKQVAQAHGWDIRVTDGTEGGARFEITGVELLPP